MNHKLFSISLSVFHSSHLLLLHIASTHSLFPSSFDPFAFIKVCMFTILHKRYQPTRYILYEFNERTITTKHQWLNLIKLRWLEFGRFCIWHRCSPIWEKKNHSPGFITHATWEHTTCTFTTLATAVTNGWTNGNFRQVRPKCQIGSTCKKIYISSCVAHCQCARIAKCPQNERNIFCVWHRTDGHACMHPLKIIYQNVRWNGLAWIYVCLSASQAMTLNSFAVCDKMKSRNDCNVLAPFYYSNHIKDVDLKI